MHKGVSTAAKVCVQIGFLCLSPSHTHTHRLRDLILFTALLQHIQVAAPPSLNPFGTLIFLFLPQFSLFSSQNGEIFLVILVNWFQ